MKLKKTTNISFYIYCIIAAGVFLLLFPTEVNALSCRFPEHIFVVDCQNGQCNKGFLIDSKMTGRMCHTRPIVIENPYDLSLIIQTLNKETPSGIYEIKANKSYMGTCVKMFDGYLELIETEPSFAQDYYGECLEMITIDKISDDSSLINQLKSEWAAKEKSILAEVNFKRYSSNIIAALIALIVILWPWLLILKWPTLKKHIIAIFFPAIVIQLILSLVFYGGAFYSYWAQTALISVLAMLASALVGFLYIIFYKINQKINK